MPKVPVSEAGPEPEDLVRRVIEDLEDALAVADQRRRKAEAAPSVRACRTRRSGACRCWAGEVPPPAEHGT
ncbi:hypothetical protein [Streptomyces sp. AC550_RSS872]|uniref:hypothetical protein n=1 Tax=Streptomyces sp. AC550_RSS872 TaxID=2823689 RepID=UPI0020B8D2DC|nr:hypothetical protein [Streptomyces sp. AC550_RSS872]